MLGKYTKYTWVPHIALGMVHLTFLILVGFKSIGSFSFIGILFLTGYVYFDNNLRALIPKYWITDTFGFSIGLLSTIAFIHFAEFSPWFAAALVGSFASFIPEKKKWINHSKLAAYAGAFAGMASLLDYSHFHLVAAACLSGGSLYFLLRNSFQGLGGKLGSIGFAASAVSFLIHYFL